VCLRLEILGLFFVRSERSSDPERVQARDGGQARETNGSDKCVTGREANGNDYG
jgi:hypothetical protein